MSKIKMGCLSLENLCTSISRVDLDKKLREDLKYLSTYPIYLEFFKHDRPLMKNDLLAGAAFVYSWMPTTLKLTAHPDNILSALGLLKQMRAIKSENIDKVKSEDIKKISEVFNGSVIAASKLLHFLNPSIFPIYDTAVYGYINNKKKPGYKVVNDSRKFCLYFRNAHEIVAEPRFIKEVYQPMNSAVEKIAGYSISVIRAIELVMFIDRPARNGT